MNLNHAAAAAVSGQLVNRWLDMRLLDMLPFVTTSQGRSSSSSDLSTLRYLPCGVLRFPTVCLIIFKMSSSWDHAKIVEEMDQRLLAELSEDNIETEIINEEIEQLHRTYRLQITESVSLDHTYH